MKATFKTVEARPGVVDRILWTAEVGDLGWGPGEHRLIDFHGDVVFMDGRRGVTNQEKAALSTKWIRGASPHGDTLHANRSIHVQLATDLPPGALQRLEELRAGGRFWVTLDGCFTVFGGLEKLSNGQPFAGLLRQFGNQGHSITSPIICDHWELPRDAWLKVINELRPANQVVFEATVPAATASSERAEQVLQKIREAQAAFDEGRYPEVSRLLYVATDWLKKDPSGLEPRYGEEMTRHIKQSLRELSSLANRERHGHPSGEVDRTDRLLAQHLLASVSGYAAIYLREPPPTS